MTMAADKQDKVLNFSSEQEQSGACSSSAEREKNQGKNFLNVPNKREQSQTCLNSAERAGLRPKGNVPTLRFPEFSGEWLATTIDGVTSEFQSGKFIKADLIQSKGSVPVYGGNGLRGYTDTYNHIGDYVLIGRQGALCGNVRFVTGETYITEHAIAVKGTEDNDTKYLQYLFERMNLGQYSDQSAQPGLAVSKLIKLKITIPPKREQSKIARLLTVIDERITTQIRIIDKLKSLMQGLNNELMDNPKWDKVYVGDFMEFYSTNSLSWEQLNYDDGQVRNLHYGLIHSGLTTLVDCQKTHLPYIQEDSLPKQYSICKDGDVAFADASEDTAEVGKVVELTNIDDKKIVCGLHTIHGRDVKGMTVKGFKGFAFNSKYFHDQLRRIAQGSKVYSINTDNLKSCYLCIPTITEQKKMVGLLHCLQDKIGVAKQELFLYESQKRFLLNNLFV